MTNTEVALLGLLTEGPKHGYQLEQDIEMRGMREWTEIGFSSIYYLLKKAEADGLVTVDVQEGGNRPARKVFSLTKAGYIALHDAVHQRLSQPRFRSSDMELALSYLALLNREECLEAVERHKQEMLTRLDHLKQKRQADRELGIPDNVEWLFDYSTTNLLNELNWITRFQEHLREKKRNDMEKENG
jgi:DNA-binding PadR family transcriptional regulator